MRKWIPLFIVALAACTPAVRTASTPARGDYDVLISNARVVDGTGNPWYHGSVAIRGDRIVYVGPSLAGQTARRVIDANGLVVAPGFIDILGHSELSLLRGPHAISKISQGITSEITGEVHSAWPNLALGEMPNSNRPWQSLDGYFRELERRGTAITGGVAPAINSTGPGSGRRRRGRLREVCGCNDSDGWYWCGRCWS